MREVDPNFVMAALICVPDAQNVEKDSTSTVHADLPLVFKNPHTSDHSPGTPPGPHNGVEPGGTGKLVLTNVSSIMLTGRGSLPAAPCSTVDVTRNHFHVFLQH